MYEVVQAASHQEALEKATIKLGDLVRVTEISVNANSDKNCTVRVVKVERTR